MEWSTHKAAWRWRLAPLPALLCVLGCAGDEKVFQDPSGAGASGRAAGGTAGGATQAGSGGSLSAGQAGVSGGKTAGSSAGGSSGGGGSQTAGAGGSGGGEPQVALTCSKSLAASASLADLQSAINSAAAGSVLCVPRAATFQGTLAINNSTPSGANRVTVCASAAGGNQCSSEGGANPRIDGQGAGITFSKSSDGFAFRNIDVVCASGCGDATGIDFGGANDIRFEGGVVSGWSQAFMCNSFEHSSPCSGIEIGARGNVTRVNDNQSGFFGWLANSFVRIDARDNGDGSVFAHHFYLSSGPRNAASTNVVFEDGYYTRSSVSGGTSMGTFLNLSGQNRDLVIRNNVFEDPQCGTYVVDCGSGGEDPEEFCDGLEISGNLFKTNCPNALNLESTQRARIFNNVFIGGGQVLSLQNGERPAADAWFFNNTVYCTANCETFFDFVGNDNRFFNNLIYATAGSNIIDGGSGACARFGGADGPDFSNNFLYAPSSSPRFPSCGSANSSDFDTLPGFAAANSEDFRLTSAAAAVGFGTAQNAPTTDFDGLPRPTPPSAGAFDAR